MIRRRDLLKLTPALALGAGLDSTARAQAGPRSFSKNSRMVMTYFFVWYDWNTREHVVLPNGTDAMTVHPYPQTLRYDKNPDYRRRLPPECSGAPLLSYMNPDWYVSQLTTMNANAIDVMAVDFWGWPWLDVAPRSRDAIQVLNQAMDFMDMHDISYPLSALFLESVPLGKSGRPTNLGTEEGAQWFFSLIRDFYSAFSNPNRIALFEGRVPVILYAANIDGLIVKAAGLRRCKELFRAWYGRDLCFFGNSTWQALAPGQIDYTCHWNASQRPTRLIDGTDLMEISPGYNYRGDTGSNRTPPNPDAYRAAWEAARSTGRNWIAIETFNEYHESTSISSTVENGDQFLRITQSQARRFKNRQ